MRKQSHVIHSEFRNRKIFGSIISPCFNGLRLYADNPLYIGEMGGGYEDTKPMGTLRESLINLLIHCDYFSPMKPRIRVFSNRIEFENPGALPRPIEGLMQTDVSAPRNPVLAKLFRVAKFCESAGYGFDKMLQWEKETGKKALFETGIGRTKFTFMLDESKTQAVDTAGKVPNSITDNQILFMILLIS